MKLFSILNRNIVKDGKDSKKRKEICLATSPPFLTSLAAPVAHRIKFKLISVESRPFGVGLLPLTSSSPLLSGSAQPISPVAVQSCRPLPSTLSFTQPGFAYVAASVSSSKAGADSLVLDSQH